MKLPNYTQIPNELIGNYLKENPESKAIFSPGIMARISGNAVKVILAVCRKTIGFHKYTDKISYSQLQELTGIKSRDTLKKAIDEAVSTGLILANKDKPNLGFEYDLNVEEYKPDLAVQKLERQQSRNWKHKRNS